MHVHYISKWALSGETVQELHEKTGWTAYIASVTQNSSKYVKKELHDDKVNNGYKSRVLQIKYKCATNLIYFIVHCYAVLNDHKRIIGTTYKKLSTSI